MSTLCDHLINFFVYLAFTYVTYSFIRHFSKGEFDDAVRVLEKYDVHDCPAGYLLHRLTYNGSYYNIQSKTSKSCMSTLDFPVRNQMLRYKFQRCQISTRTGNGTSVPEYNTSDFTAITEWENTLLETACSKINSSNTKFHGPSVTNQPETSVVRRFFSYWFEIVKGPLPDLPEPKSQSEEWDINTLLGGIFPGTLWCGFGNIADDVYTKLGELHYTDACCRAHDLCQPKIRAFQTRYYYNNPSIIPLSHCSCDMDFYNCLKRVNSPEAVKIGNIYFNLVKIKCFDFDIRDVCVREFFGFCFKMRKLCAAVIKNSIKF